MNKKTNSIRYSWKKPELIILTHSTDDEVLTGDCKLQSASIGPTSANNKCDEPKNNNNLCGACQAENGTS